MATGPFTHVPYQVTPAPTRRRRWPWLLVAGLVAVLVVAGGTAWYAWQRLGPANDLRARLIGMPSPAVACPGSSSAGATLSLAQDAELYRDPQARRDDLTENKFVRGAMICWLLDGGKTEVRLLQFASPDWAQGELGFDLGGMQISYGSPVALRTVPGSAVAATAASSGFFFSMAVLTRGDVLAEVLHWDLSQSSPYDLEPTIAAQYARLPG